MKLIKLAKAFLKDDAGAVTVDWVVLTAAIVGLGLAVMGIVGPAIRSGGSTIATKIGTASTAATTTP